MAKEKKQKKIRTEKKQGKIARAHMIQSKIHALVILGVALAVAATVLILISYVKGLVIDSAYGKMLNMATSYGCLIDQEEAKLDNSVSRKYMSTEQAVHMTPPMTVCAMHLKKSSRQRRFT